jgi:valyl-tRNA synthetase
MLGDTRGRGAPGRRALPALVGKHVELPLTGARSRSSPTTYVDPAFGSGCVKITPAHDFNDYDVGKRHKLPLINIFTADAALNDTVPRRTAASTASSARKRVVPISRRWADREDRAAHAPVPRGDRSGAVLEPWLTDQWYVRIAPLAEPRSRRCATDASASYPETGRAPTSSG